MTPRSHHDESAELTELWSERDAHSAFGGDWATQAESTPATQAGARTSAGTRTCHARGVAAGSSLPCPTFLFAVLHLSHRSFSRSFPSLISANSHHSQVTVKVWNAIQVLLAGKELATKVKDEIFSAEGVDETDQVIDAAFLDEVVDIKKKGEALQQTAHGQRPPRQGLKFFVKGWERSQNLILQLHLPLRSLA